jgi:hypothetical protein
MCQNTLLQEHLRRSFGRWRRVFYRPALEQLEDRLAPAAVDYKALAAQLDQQLAGLSGLASIVSQSTADLPILGSSLADDVADVNLALK